MDKIVTGALDSSLPLADVLRVCVAIGNQTQSDILRGWAVKELTGYGSDDEVPPYRAFAASLWVTLENSGGEYHERLVRSALPEQLAEAIDDRVVLRQNVATLELDARKADLHNYAMTFDLARADDVVQMINQHAELPPETKATAVAWRVEPTVVLGVLDHMRTKLVDLASDLVGEIMSGQATLSSEQADQATRVAVYGGTNHFVMPSTSGGVSTTTVTHGAAETTTRWVRFWRTSGWWIALVVAVIGAVAGLGQWLHWEWFK
ncbi:AbiTii domain-containing protein [Nonomuraea sp. NPDC003707]